MGNGTDRYGRDFDDPAYGNYGLESGRGGSSKVKFAKGDGAGFLDNFKKGALSYYEASQKNAEKTDTDKMIDFYKETLKNQGSPSFGGTPSAYSTELAQGLTTFVPAGTQQMFIPGQEGKKGLFSLGGAIRGGIGGFMKGGPAGALGGAAMGGFM